MRSLRILEAPERTRCMHYVCILLVQGGACRELFFSFRQGAGVLYSSVGDTQKERDCCDITLVMERLKERVYLFAKVVRIASESTLFPLIVLRTGGTSERARGRAALKVKRRRGCAYLNCTYKYREPIVVLFFMSEENKRKQGGDDRKNETEGRWKL